MLGNVRIYLKRKDNRRTRRIMAAMSNDLKKVPPKLRDASLIDIEKSIDNVHRILLTRDLIGSITQDRIRSAIDDILLTINHRIRPHAIHLRDLRDSSDDRVSSGTPSPKQHVELPAIQQAPQNLPPPAPSADADVYQESDPGDHIPADSMKGKPDFRKFVDQLREDLLTIFVPEIMVPPLEHFPNHSDQKLAFAKILKAARIYKRSEIDDIIASVQ